MPISCGRTAGVNHELSPSKIPRMPPRISPYVILFMASLRNQCALPVPAFKPARYASAIRSISTRKSRGSRATSTVVRAGGSLGK